ncbi:MAG: hypothetical protein G01um1014106_538 [Parcubacteria group bacterium Gr01-1014_106]|nr:MAG: hypothetical protein G01um1014106_538 [Parcubacteria group bacterium Gr01-1014_106]
MHPLWFLLIFGVPVLLFLLAMLLLYTQKVIRVNPANTQRVVVKNVATGQLRVLGPGAHPIGPGWQEFATVQLNREPIEVSGEDAEEVRSSDGLRLAIEYRFDIVSGRPFNRTTGVLTTPADDLSAVTDEMVRLAVTAINYAEREERTQEIIKTALDAEFGQYTGDQLTVPESVGAFIVPAAPVPGVVPEPVQNTAKLYEKLAQAVEARANQDLLHVGINLVDVRITNLRYKDERLQGALEHKKRIEKLKAATEQLIDPRDPDPLTRREALAADTDQYGTIALAQMGRELAKKIPEGLVDAVKEFKKP